jgi:hypothetical protein
VFCLIFGVKLSHAQPKPEFQETEILRTCKIYGKCLKESSSMFKKGVHIDEAISKSGYSVHIYGGLAGIHDPYSKMSVEKNFVQVFNNIFTTAAYMIGGRVRGNGNVARNSVSIGNESNITADGIVHLCGGFVDGRGGAEYNEVCILGYIIARRVEIFGGVGSDGNANGNVVDFKGTISVAPYQLVKICGGLCGNGSSTENIVNLSGTIDTTNITVEIYGGQVGDGYATLNTINIINYSFFRANNRIRLYGGYVCKTGDSVTGNTLNFLAKEGIEVESICGFQNFNFVLDENIKQEGILLSFLNPLDLSDKNINLEIGKGSQLEVGYNVILMRSRSKIINFNKIEIKKEVQEEVVVQNIIKRIYIFEVFMNLECDRIIALLMDSYREYTVSPFVKTKF